MPRIGLGLWGPREGSEAEGAAEAALAAGYRLFDSAAVYANERSLGRALARSGLKRAEYFIVGKVWFEREGPGEPKKAVMESLARLGLGHFDLGLIHWPTRRCSLTFKALSEMAGEGPLRAIGVANFSPDQLRALMGETGLVPHVWQMEIHPLRIRDDVREMARELGIALMAHCPLARGRLKKNQIVGRLAAKYQKSFAQVILRWAWQKGLCPIPKSVRPDRIRENAQIFDFALAAEDVAALDRLDQGQSVLKPPFCFDEDGYVLGHLK
jgi:diketogulonate reductase-like aldo/keto reductase